MTKYLVVLLPSREVNETIKNLREELDLNYSHTIQPHLTLIPPFFAKEAPYAKLKKIASETTSFRIDFGQIKSFPKPRRITYFSVSNPKEVKLLRSKLFEELEKFGPFREKFIPHITLAKEVSSLSRIQKTFEASKKKLEFGVNSFYLFKKKGEIWKEVRKFPFKTL